MSRVLLCAFALLSCAESSRPPVTEADVWIDDEGAHARGLPREECSFVERVALSRVDSVAAEISPPLGFYVSHSVELGGALRVAVQVVEPVPAGELDVRLFVNGELAEPSSAAVACTIGSSP
jgi:hypothetical protein